ncbi:MAG: rRNA maturation RNase YbeY [Thermoguttaceae bacterium]
MTPKDRPFLLEILDEQDFMPIDRDAIQSVCEKILSDHSIHSGHLEIVFVDSDTIQQYNKEFLKHDYPTDVISFPMEYSVEKNYLEGEILACTQVAQERASEFSWTPEEELLLYVIHGILHLVGLDDTSPESQKIMHQKEKEYLAFLNINTPDWDIGFEDDD